MDPVTRAEGSRKAFVQEVLTAAYKLAQKILTSNKGEVISSAGDSYKSQVLTNPPVDFAPILSTLAGVGGRLLEPDAPSTLVSGPLLRQRVQEKREEPQKQVPVEGDTVREADDPTLSKAQVTNGERVTGTKFDEPKAPPFQGV